MDRELTEIEVEILEHFYPNVYKKIYKSLEWYF